MIALDASFLVDYLDGVPVAKSFLEARRDHPFHAPALALFEAYRGGARTGGREHVERISDGLAWVEPLSFDGVSARQAALVEADLLDAGKPINVGDVIIAGTCLHHGATLVTRDDHFEYVDGLDVVRYDE